MQHSIGVYPRSSGAPTGFALEGLRDAKRVYEKTTRGGRAHDVRQDAVIGDGDGIGAGVIDQLRYRGYGDRDGLYEFHGGARPHDPNMYFNRRAEIWGHAANGLKAGAQIPDSPDLEVDLTGPQYGYSNKSQSQLEKKKDMKARGLASPDLGDTLAMTFAVNVNARVRERKEWFEELARYRYHDPSPDSWMA